MKRSRIVAAAGLVAAAAAAAIGIAAFQNAQEPPADKAVTAVHKTDRGVTRTLVVLFNSASGSTLTLDATNEIDVGTITFANGLFTSGASDPGGIRFTTSALVDLLYLATPGYGTQQFTFDPPFRLRSGDRLIFLPNTSNSTTTEWDVTLHGTNPAAKSDGAAVF